MRHSGVVPCLFPSCSTFEKIALVYLVLVSSALIICLGYVKILCSSVGGRIVFLLVNVKLTWSWTSKAFNVSKMKNHAWGHWLNNMHVSPCGTPEHTLKLQQNVSV